MNSDFVTVLQEEIDNGRPMQLSVIDDVRYGNHGTMVTGYRKYTGSMRLTNRVYISVELWVASIFDGHSQNERWIDLTTYSTMPPDYSRSNSQLLSKYILE